MNSEWWTYRLGDFLLFAPRTYYRLFELYNREIWPVQAVAMVLGIAILVLCLRRDDRWRGRGIAAILALTWLWVGWAFHLERYVTINWAAKWFAAGFAAQALLFVWIGVIRNRLQLAPMSRFGRIGLGLFVFALAIQPLIGPLVGRRWIQIELFGIAPDPTAVATLGILLLGVERVHVTLIVLPVLWCAISGATLAAMESPDAFVTPVTAALVMSLAIWKGVVLRRSHSIPHP